MAEGIPAVRDTLLNCDPEAAVETIRALPESGEFVTAFDAYLEQYGCRAGTWELSSPTWQEDPASPLRLVRRILEEKPASPEESLREGARRREAAITEATRQLAGDEARLARFRELTKPFAHYIPIREGRAFWQLVLTGAMRSCLLQRGRVLVERGALKTADEVFYLSVEEMVSGMRGEDRDFATHVAERRAAWQFWAQRQPPASIGGKTEGMPDAGDAVADGVIKGLAASRGLITAKARVLRSIDDADRLQKGEVLVCAMSSPPWTPLFAIAAAVVTDSGGALSHPAIVAREYGIPCVVGTRIGTQRIRDGDVITVDGTNGVIQLEGM